MVEIPIKKKKNRGELKPKAASIIARKTEISDARERMCLPGCTNVTFRRVKSLKEPL